MRNQMRTFALDRITDVESKLDKCMDVSEEILNQYLASSYGIFSGEAKQKAILLFSSKRARWVADEKWHPKQIGVWLPDGRYQLEIPYSDQRELLMDIMRHLPEVEVVAPIELKEQLVFAIKLALKTHKIY